MSDWPWVAAAYGLTWLVLGIYAVILRRRLSRARRELEELREHPDNLTEVEP